MKSSLMSISINVASWKFSLAIKSTLSIGKLNVESEKTKSTSLLKMSFETIFQLYYNKHLLCQHFQVHLIFRLLLDPISSCIPVDKCCIMTLIVLNI